MSKPVKTAIVLQGGGALGAYQYGAIKYLYEQDPDLSPHIVTGVSIGAVNAAVMLGGKYGSVKSLEKLWKHVVMKPLPFAPQAWQAALSKWGNPHMYTLNASFFSSPLTATSLYDLQPFISFLKDLIDFEKLNNSPTEVVLEAVNVETGQLQKFSNKTDMLTVKHVVASMSIPPNFSAMEIKDNFYWDGGLYANMPLAPAINSLEAVEEDAVRQIYIISLFRKGAKMPVTIEEITNRIKELMFESKVNLDVKWFKQTDKLIDFFQQLDQELPADSKLREGSIFKKMVNHKRINRFAHLQYEGEGVTGTDDFTPDAITYRIRTGYRDAQQNPPVNV